MSPAPWCTGSDCRKFNLKAGPWRKRTPVGAGDLMLEQEDDHAENHAEQQDNGNNGKYDL